MIILGVYVQVNETRGSYLLLDVVMKTMHWYSSSHRSLGLRLRWWYSADVARLHVHGLVGAALEKGLSAGGFTGWILSNLAWAWRVFQFTNPSFNLLKAQCVKTHLLSHPGFKEQLPVVLLSMSRVSLSWICLHWTSLNWMFVSSVVWFNSVHNFNKHRQFFFCPTLRPPCSIKISSKLVHC